MAINFKPINELPEIESVSEGDKLLVNSGGTAKQIDASKFAESGSGSGGGSAPAYLKSLDDEFADMPAYAAYKDEGMTQMMTYAEGLAAAKGGAMWALKLSEEDPMMYCAALTAAPMGYVGTKAIMLAFMMTGSDSGIVAVFSDTEM